MADRRRHDTHFVVRHARAAHTVGDLKRNAVLAGAQSAHDKLRSDAERAIFVRRPGEIARGGRALLWREREAPQPHGLPLPHFGVRGVRDNDDLPRLPRYREDVTHGAARANAFRREHLKAAPLASWQRVQIHGVLGLAQRGRDRAEGPTAVVAVAKQVACAAAAVGRGDAHAALQLVRASRLQDLDLRRLSRHIDHEQLFRVAGARLAAREHHARGLAVEGDLFEEVDARAVEIPVGIGQNEDKIFKSVHNETKFGLLTITGGRDAVEQPWFTAHIRQPEQITDSERRYALTIDEIEAINPNTLNLPAFRWAKDAEVTATIHKAAPVLVRRHGDSRVDNPWQVSFTRMFDMANDSGSFLDHQDIAPLITERREALAVLEDGRQVYPLYEGKMFWHFDHRYGTYEGQTEKQSNKGVLPRVLDSKHDDPGYRIEPRYWVDVKLTTRSLSENDRYKWFFAWRDVGISERTFIGTIIPKTAAGDKSPILLSPLAAKSIAALVGCLSSLVTDYSARQRAMNMKYFVVEQLPVPTPSVLSISLPWLGHAPEDWLADRVLELSYTNEELAAFAADMGRDHPPFRWKPGRRVLLQAEIDAAVLHLYGLNPTQAEWLLDSFTVLRKYEERDHGEFRTKRVVLEIYDEMATAKQTGRAYQTRLTPPPADSSCCHAPVAAAIAVAAG
jgi:hypothetical protein